MMPVQKIDINMEFRRPVGELFALLSDHEKMGPILGANVKRTRRPREPRKLNPQRAEEAAGVIIICRTGELPVPSSR
jgi:hypothetical protein